MKKAKNPSWCLKTTLTLQKLEEPQPQLITTPQCGNTLSHTSQRLLYKPLILPQLSKATLPDLGCFLSHTENTQPQEASFTKTPPPKPPTHTHKCLCPCLHAVLRPRLELWGADPPLAAQPPAPTVLLSWGKHTHRLHTSPSATLFMVPHSLHLKCSPRSASQTHCHLLLPPPGILGLLQHLIPRDRPGASFFLSTLIPPLMSTSLSIFVFCLIHIYLSNPYTQHGA